MAPTLRKLVLERAVLPLAGALSPFRTQHHLERMLASDFDDLQTREARRQSALATLLEHAANTTELYRERLSGLGDPAAIARPEGFLSVPITSKDDLRREFPRRQLAATHRRSWLRYSNTSGTTGAPLMLIQDVDDISAKYASILRSRVLAGADPMSSQARITPNECQPARADGSSRGGLGAHGDGLFVRLEREVINPCFHQRLMLPPFWGSEQPTRPLDLEPYFEKIERFAPEVLTLYPPYAWLMARAILERGRRSPLTGSGLDFSGAMSTPSMRARIEEAFGARAAQGCGGCEFARYGASCASDPERMHLAETHCYVETLRPDGSPCASGELGNVVVTSLHSWAMPILRLEPGDVARVFDEPCTCGRRSRRIEHHGRIHSLLQTHDGRWVSGRDVWERLFAIGGFELFQLTQRSTTDYALEIIAAADLDRDGIEAALRDLLGGGIALTIDLVPELRTRRSGKLQLVRSSTYERFRVAAARDREVPLN